MSDLKVSGKQPGFGPLMLALVAACLTIKASPHEAAPTPVSISPAFFNPSLGQSVTILATVTREDTASIAILDPQRVPIRRLASKVRVKQGTNFWQWDGRDDAGKVVADEAYSLKIDFGTAPPYFPAHRRLEDVSVGGSNYDAHRGVVTYELPKAARVRVVASDRMNGSISNVIVNWEPRAAGSVLEPWSGFDGTGRINLLSKPDSRITIEARALCENALIVIGNRGPTSRESRRSDKRGSMPRQRGER